MASHLNATLSESTRLHYLEAMGIRQWVRRNASPTAGEIDGVEARIGEESVPSDSTEAAADATVINVEQGVGGGPSLVADAHPLDWPELEQAVASCVQCPELVANRTQSVFGVGNRGARLLVIGEAPGADEDRQGEPFVGKAGQLLNLMLAAIGLQRAEVYIANVLKCRPPNNRDPKPDEVANCHGFLQRQIDLIKPEAILVVGRIAAQSLLNSSEPVGKLRGQLHHLTGGIPLIVTYHPAYLLRSPAEKHKSWQDLRRLQQLLKESL